MDNSLQIIRNDRLGKEFEREAGPSVNWYIWGDALAVLEAIQPDLRIINLETSVTKSDESWPGKFLNDYAGIGGYEEYRGDLSPMYLPSFAPSTGRLVEMRLFPVQIRRFQTIHASPDDSKWLMEMLNREGKQLGTRLFPAKDGSFVLEWDKR